MISVFFCFLSQLLHVCMCHVRMFYFSCEWVPLVFKQHQTLPLFSFSAFAHSWTSGHVASLFVFRVLSASAWHSVSCHEH
jgi:hypothetical protein